MIFRPADFSVYRTVLRFYDSRRVTWEEAQTVTGRLDCLMYPPVRWYPN